MSKFGACAYFGEIPVVHFTNSGRIFWEVNELSTDSGLHIL
jgi:hypothetical protein